MMTHPPVCKWFARSPVVDEAPELEDETENVPGHSRALEQPREKRVVRLCPAHLAKDPEKTYWKAPSREDVAPPTARLAYVTEEGGRFHSVLNPLAVANDAIFGIGLVTEFTNWSIKLIICTIVNVIQGRVLGASAIAVACIERRAATKQKPDNVDLTIHCRLNQRRAVGKQIIFGTVFRRSGIDISAAV